MLAWCYAGTDMVDWRNMTFLWQSAVSSCYQHISSCNYCTASLGLGRKKYHSLTGRYVWAGPVRVRETDNKWTEILRPSVSQSNVTCWTCRLRGSPGWTVWLQNTSRELFAYFANCEIQPMKQSLPTSLIKIGHGLPCIISARSLLSQPPN